MVLGHEAERVKPLMAQRKVSTVVNGLSGRGQSSSLKAGLGELAPDFDAVLFLLGDQPLVTADTIDLIIAAFGEFPSPIIIPTFDGQRGNPVLFSRETFPRMESLSGDCGARALFQEYVGKIHSVEVHTPAILFDLEIKRLPPPAERALKHFCSRGCRGFGSE